MMDFGNEEEFFFSCLFVCVCVYVLKNSILNPGPFLLYRKLLMNDDVDDKLSVNVKKNIMLN